MASNDYVFSNNSNNHSIIKEFRRNNESLNFITRSLIDVKNNLFFLFDISTGCILVTRCLSFVYETPLQRYQVFKPEVSVQGDVTVLRVSEDCTQAALLSTTGLYIVDLPHVSQCCSLPQHVDNVSSSRVWLYVPNESKSLGCKMKQARWHPSEPFLIVVLFDDNCIRLVDTQRKQVLRIGLDQQSSAVPVTECAVDFDFLTKGSRGHGDNTVWNTMLAVTKTNGEILRTCISKNCKSKLKPFVVVPKPPRSTHSLIVLQCTPPIVVFTDDSGNIYHSLMFEHNNEPVLRIFEKFKIDGVMSRIKNLSNSMKLIKDSFSCNRYFCIHDAGVHSAVLPVVSSIEKFITTNKSDSLEEYLKLNEAVKSSRSLLKCVQCTLLPDMSTPQPVYGIGLIPHRLETQQVVVLLADATTNTFFISDIFPRLKLQMKADNNDSPTDAKRMFIDVITEFLRNNQNKRPPVMAVALELRNKPISESSKIFMNYLAMLREYGLEQHKFIGDIIGIKAKELCKREKQQLLTIETLKAAKEELKRNAERIAERYEEINDKHALIMKGVENMGLSIGGFNTIGNRKQTNEFYTIQKKTLLLQTEFQEVLNKIKILKAQETTSGSEAENSLHLRNSENNKIVSRLAVQGKSINEVKKKIEDMAAELNVTKRSLKAFN